MSLPELSPWQADIEREELTRFAKQFPHDLAAAAQRAQQLKALAKTLPPVPESVAPWSPDLVESH